MTTQEITTKAITALDMPTQTITMQAISVGYGYVGYNRVEFNGIVQYYTFSDMFAFFLDGENLALTSDGSVVSVQTVNQGNPCA